jgi:hypothetical protein
MIEYTINGKVDYLPIEELQTVERSGRSRWQDYAYVAKEWMPEVGSPSYQRRWDGWRPTFHPEAIGAFAHAVKCMTLKRPVIINVPKSRIKTGVKYHWESNAVCGHVRKGIPDRVVDGNAFNAVPKGERCICCDYWFTNG